jgi:hypothetical protein
MVMPGAASGHFADNVFDHLQLRDSEIFDRGSQHGGEHRALGLTSPVPVLLPVT